MLVISTECYDYSKMGQHRGISGPSARTFLTVTADIKLNRYEIVVNECAPDFPVSYWERELGSLYDIITLTFGPEDLGWWVDRQRRHPPCLTKTAFRKAFRIHHPGSYLRAPNNCIWRAVS